jgi:chromate transport protein ChrA
MSTRKTILIHGGLAAGALAVVGYLYAQLAGMWVATQSETGRGATDTGAIVSTLAWRLPFTMAAIGFALVAIGEGLKSLWKSPPKREEPTLAEAEMQRLLGEQETLPETGAPAAMLGR